MAERAELVAICDRYVELVDAGDTEAIMDLYAQECWIEDPIGSEHKVGRDVVREFYASIAALEVNPRMTRIGPVTVCGGEAAFQFRIDIEIGEMTIKMTSTDVMTFDDSGKITSMRAFADAEADPDR
jgi:steroid delta-isomerase